LGSYSSEENFNGERRYNKNDNNRRQWLQDPIDQTAVIESGNTKICFSMEPVKQCSPGTFETNANGEKGDRKIDNDGGDDSAYETDIVRKELEKTKDSKTVKFACVNRSSESRKLLRQARRGVVLDMSNYRVSFTESVSQATGKCARY